MIWLDFSDLVYHFETQPAYTGIQRVELDLASAMRAIHKDVRICACFDGDGTFKTVPLEELIAWVEWPVTQPPSLTQQPNAIVRRIRKTAVSLVPKIIRYRLGFDRKQLRRPKLVREGKANFKEGDVLLMLGAFWYAENHVDRIQNVVFVNGLKLSILVHDLIPVNQPHWFTPEHSNSWGDKLRTLLRQTECIFSSSQNTADEIRHFASSHKIRTGEITPVRFGDPTFIRRDISTHGCADKNANAPAILQYRGKNFVLMVSTFEIRKNQKVLLPIWSRLLREFGREQTPDLLLVGKAGPGLSQFLSLLDGSPELKTKITILPKVYDGELAHYYKSSLFTVFPSLTEGWGLPVAESLSFGKVCVASDAGAIPEAGGKFIRYFPVNDLGAAYNAIKELVMNPEERRRLESVIANEYHSTEWTLSARTILETLGAVPRTVDPDDTSGSIAGGGRPFSGKCPPLRQHHAFTA
jgi:glycosyltransferase involved in cell wall biosynthesis